MSKVTAKYQITVPPEVRKDLGIIPGTEVGITRKGDKYILIVKPINELKRKWRERFKDGMTTDIFLEQERLCPHITQPLACCKNIPLPQSSFHGREPLSNCYIQLLGGRVKMSKPSTIKVFCHPLSVVADVQKAA